MKNKIDDLFRKTIASLVSIKIISHNEEIKKEADDYLYDLVYTYYDYIQKSKLSTNFFKCKAKNIDDFAYKCIDEKEDDLMRLAEDVQYGVLELTEEILKNKKLYMIWKDFMSEDAKQTKGGTWIRVTTDKNGVITLEKQFARPFVEQKFVKSLKLRINNLRKK